MTGLANPFHGGVATSGSLTILIGCCYVEYCGKLRSSVASEIQKRTIVADDLDQPEIVILIELALERAKVTIDPANESKIIIKSISENQRPRRPTSK